MLSRQRTMHCWQRWKTTPAWRSNRPRTMNQHSVRFHLPAPTHWNETTPPSRPRRSQATHPRERCLKRSPS